MSEHKYKFDWSFSDTTFTKDKGQVFSCFACGGGSTMGYKLAGFDVIGCNEIDYRMMKVYRENHSPKYSFLEPIQEFKKKENLPDELYNLDILDGSPPCSSFSTAGSRAKSWGKAKHFREGQARQVLDTLFFDFIDLAKRLQPKVVVAENVKGILLGDAIQYVRRIYEEFRAAGYYCRHWLLDAQKMGVPQRRQRVFFVCLRKDLASPFLKRTGLFDESLRLDLNFDEELIPFGHVVDYSGREITSPKMRERWERRQEDDNSFSDASLRMCGKKISFNTMFAHNERICPCLTGKEDCVALYDRPKYLGASEVCKVATFPQDYDFAGQLPHYICGMSVPPVMMAQIASQIHLQWLSKM